MSKINHLPVIYKDVILVLDNQEAELSFKIEDWECKLVISFGVDGGANQTLNASLESDHLKLKFNNWVNSLGTVFSDPINIGTSPSGRSIELMVMHHKVGKVNKMDLQFTLGASNG